MKNEISKQKYIIVFLLLVLSGYFLSRIYIQFLAPLEVKLISVILKKIKSTNSYFNTVVFKDFVLYFFSNISRVLLSFLACFVLAKSIGVKKIWIAGFIISFVLISVFVNIDSLIYYYFELGKIPDYGLKPSIIGFIVDLVIIPIICIYGCILENKLKKAYQKH